MTDADKNWPLRELLADIRQRQLDTHEEVRESRSEMRDGIREVSARVDNLDRRVGSLEKRSNRESGASEVKRSIGRWASGIAAGLVSAGAIGAAGWLLRGCA